MNNIPADYNPEQERIERQHEAENGKVWLGFGIGLFIAILLYCA